MPAEVISLLSSSPSPVIPAKRASPHPARPVATVSASRNFSSYDDFDELEQFDLTQDVVIPRSSLDPRSSLGGNNPSKTSKARSSEPIETDPISLLSDDDFSFSNVRHARRGGDGPSPKRTRLTPPDEHSKRPDIFQSWDFSRLNSAAEQSPRPTKSKPSYDKLVFDDDPFASSPPRIPEKKNRSTKRAAFEDLDPFASSPPKNLSRQPVAQSKRAAAWDPISSSAPQLNREDSMTRSKPRALQRVQSEVIALDDSDDSMGRALSEDDDDDDLPDLDDFDEEKLRKLKAKIAARLPSSKASAKSAAKARVAKAGSGSQPRAPAVKTSYEKEKEKEEKLAKAVAREAERNLKQREKIRQREEKALEKERAAALAAVNKVRTDKKVSTPEMIVDLPSSISESIKVQAEALLNDLDVESHEWDSPVDNVVRWRRKVKSQWNEELGHWEPIPMRIERENYAMVLMSASQFVELALATEGTDLDTHVTQVVSQFPGQSIIFLLEGLKPWLRKNRTLRNRQFVSAVRDGLDGGEPSNSQPSGSQPPSGTQQPRRRKKAAQPQQYIDEDMIEDALLQMQVAHDVLIHHVHAPVETAQWIATFTQHISTVPYRRQREETNAVSAGFCMESGQVRTGENAKDTYLRMLQEVGRITAPIAYGIAGEFPTVSQLVEGLERGGPLVLQAVRKSANKDGAFSDRAIGPSVSRRLHKIFTGTDEMSTDI
ncbi:ERCC4 domain-containing protein [Podospora aff. communis PSN243]|uniref:ERCC4 domain-containing protein n=1 Tax=Podospora aff. communis PSN243 TaxID=3040156 RepID=A0AAV9H669_9PEZI|nr:ERCC4 domain-containing protein [Podospora aff. communis PSN243]